MLSNFFLQFDIDIRYKQIQCYFPTIHIAFSILPIPLWLRDSLKKIFMNFTAILLLGFSVSKLKGTSKIFLLTIYASDLESQNGRM